ncbi:hypothetical protein Tco_0540923 [Tanacetum coccineum]
MPRIASVSSSCQTWQGFLLEAILESVGLGEKGLNSCCTNGMCKLAHTKEHYTKLLDPIPELHQVQQNDNNVISAVSNMEQSGGIVEQHPATAEETRALYDSLYNNLAIEVEKVNTINRKLKETNAESTTELARYKN